MVAARRPAAEVARGEATRQAILLAAAREFRANGYSGARLVDIAARVGMKAGSLYYHFASREDLVQAVMDEGLRATYAAVVQRLAALSPTASHRRRLETAIVTHVELVLANEDIASATIKLIWQAPPDIREAQLERQRAYGAVWKQLLADARAAGEIRADLDLSVVRMATMGALNWAADWYAPGRMTPSEVARDMAAMILGGLAAD
jgi:AcrR family transcriptional regulator